MTAPSSRDLPPVLDALPDGARFKRAPSAVGPGEILIAEGVGGCVAIAPPWVPLRGGENAYEHTHWRFGVFDVDDDFVELDEGPRSEGTVAFPRLWDLPGLAEHGAYLRDCFIARARHFTRMSERLEGDERALARAEVTAMRDEWAAVFPADPWPLSEPRAQPRRRFLSLILHRTLVPFEGVHGPTDDAEETTAAPSFGPYVTVEPEGDRAVLVIDFDGLRDDEPDAPGEGPVIVCLVRKNEVLAETAVELATSTRRVPLAIHPEVLAAADVRVAFAAPDETT